MFDLRRAKAREEAEARMADIHIARVAPDDMKDERVRKLIERMGSGRKKSKGVVCADLRDRDVQELLRLLHEKAEERLKRRMEENPEDPATRVLMVPYRNKKIHEQMIQVLEAIRKHEEREDRAVPSAWALALSEDMHALFDATEHGMEMIRKKYPELKE